jgi:hypothetical protein
MKAASAKVPELEQLLLAARHVPIVMLSYGGPTKTLDHLTEIISRERAIKVALSIRYSHLRSIASEAHNAQNREYLIIATR